MLVISRCTSTFFAPGEQVCHFSGDRDGRIGSAQMWKYCFGPKARIITIHIQGGVELTSQMKILATSKRAHLLKQTSAG